MIELYEIAVLSENVELELLLGYCKRDQMVKSLYAAATIHKLVEFEKIVAVLVCISLILSTERILCEFVVIGECDYVIPESVICLEDFFRCEFAFVQRPFNTSVSVEIRSFPAC